ncbi:MAG: FliI/YscN family ATPase [Pirellula sp.]|jgi:flagellum-specific ATP synthase
MIRESFPPLIDRRHWSQSIKRVVPFGVTGRVRSIRGTTIVVDGLPVPVGALVNVHRRQQESMQAEVIGFDNGKTILAPLDNWDGVSPGDRVELFQTYRSVTVSDNIIGRVLDATGQPMDDLGPLGFGRKMPCDAPPVPALHRPPIDRILPTQVRALDMFLTLGCGQRMGIFAGSGVGKSTILGMLARGTQADHVVIALIGERGREVREFLDRDLGEEGRAKSVTVVATSDQPAPKRILAAKTATAIAESLRDEGKNVLLLMDSVTRFAMAQREVGLAAGEVPTTRGYPPSVFAMLPQLVERSGISQKGSITALYTVLVEGDDTNEPISDTLRGLLDGHIHLSRSIAARGRYPAIDVLPSLSRLQSHLITPELRQAADNIRSLMAVYKENEDLINIGAYTRGSNPVIDRAIQMRSLIENFLAQGTKELISWDQSVAGLLALSSQANQAGNVAGATSSGSTSAVMPTGAPQTRAA